MCFGRRVLWDSLVVFVTMLVLQAWVCCHSHSFQAGAIRIFPAHHKDASVTAAEAYKAAGGAAADVMDRKKKGKEDLFDKYLDGMRSTFGAKNRTSSKAFEETKRNVPSCPDPLHN